MAAKGLFLRQTSYIGYSTPCNDYICWYDSTWNIVPALRSASTGPASLQAIPETGLAPCSTNSNKTCPWYLILLPDHTCIVALDNATAAFAKAATWCVLCLCWSILSILGLLSAREWTPRSRRVIPGLSNASDVSFQSGADPSLYLSAAEAAPSGSDIPPVSNKQLIFCWWLYSDRLLVARDRGRCGRCRCRHWPEICCLRLGRWRNRTVSNTT